MLQMTADMLVIVIVILMALVAGQIQYMFVKLRTINGKTKMFVSLSEHLPVSFLPKFHSAFRKCFQRLSRTRCAWDVQLTWLIFFRWRMDTCSFKSCAVVIAHRNQKGHHWPFMSPPVSKQMFIHLVKSYAVCPHLLEEFGLIHLWPTTVWEQWWWSYIAKLAQYRGLDLLITFSLPWKNLLVWEVCSTRLLLIAK